MASDMTLVNDAGEVVAYVRAFHRNGFVIFAHQFVKSEGPNRAEIINAIAYNRYLDEGNPPYHYRHNASNG